MLPRRPVRSLACAAVLGIGVLTAAPSATAATVAAQATGSAATITVAGEAQGTGTTKATNDGSGEQTSGEAKPALGDTLLPDAGINSGVLYQDATATTPGGVGTSAACAGLAGDGAAIVQTGQGECLTGGDDLNFDLGNLDLAKLSPVAGELSPLAGLNDPVKAILAPIAAPLQANVIKALQEQLDVSLRVGSIQAWCTAKPNEVDGNGNVTGPLSLIVTLGGQEIKVLDIPISTEPNQKVLTGLDGVTQAVIDGLKTELTSLTAGALKPLEPALLPLGQGLQTIQDQIVKTLVQQLQPALQPLEENILDGTINKQSRTDNSIDITALDLKVLPVAGTQSIGLSIGHVTCGPNGRVAAPGETPAQGGPKPEAKPKDNLPAVPTAVSSGAEEASGTTLSSVVWGSAGALLLIAGSGALWRRARITA